MTTRALGPSTSATLGKDFTLVQAPPFRPPLGAAAACAWSAARVMAREAR